MNNNAKSLAARRAELVEQCAQQREYLAMEVAALRSPLSFDVLRDRLGANHKLLLAVGGVGLGLFVTRPKRLLKLAAGVLPLVGAIRKYLPMLPR